jgi:hypothetical protein
MSRMNWFVTPRQLRVTREPERQVNNTELDSELRSVVTRPWVAVFPLRAA